AGRGGAETFVALRYDAGALWAVMSPPRDQPARVWILRDEQWPARETLGDDARQDSRGAAYVDVTEPRLYAIARATPGQHVVKLSPDARGLTIHALVLEPLDAGRSRR
ncbi:MAG: hypothetical protein HYR74_06130, partial [Candidatus Eisenbacteria bacterium]|nr:hypothetical protein [Candidatus Eisenbacteria bacterium]